MKTFDNETSRESCSVDKREFGFRSFSLINWVHILISIIWWLYNLAIGMFSSFHGEKGGFETHAFSAMCNLRILQLNYVQLNGPHKNLPKGLRLLCMHGFPSSYIPSDLQMENMVALDMSNSKLKQLWKKPKLLRSLKFLNLSCCRELVSVGHFSGLPLLEWLILTRCTLLVEVCESIGNYCDRLEVLDLSNCKKLKKLPRSIGKLRKLKELSIDGCSGLGGVPCEIKDMESVEVLEANNINIVSFSAIVEAIPRSPKSLFISFPNSLVSLSLKNNNLSNESFPKDFSGLPMLKELYLDANPIESLPDCVRSLSMLNFLSLSNCHGLKTVLCAQNTITKLKTYNCYSLEKITFHPEISMSNDVFYYEALSLSEIQGRFKMEAIAEVDEEILLNLGWINVEYVKQHKLSIADWAGYYYRYTGRIHPAQMLYEHGIFSTYLEGNEMPKWFTQKSNGSSSFILHPSPKNCKIRGLNLCIVSTISSIAEAGPSRIRISNLTKNCSWTYQPQMFVLPEGNEEVVVWLSHWMFGNNELQDGDEVSLHVRVQFRTYKYDVWYDVEREDYADVRECGISLVYDDGTNKEEEDALGYYKSWKHIIGQHLSHAASELYSSHYLLQPIYVG